MIFRNAMKTPDGRIIESHTRHDYVTYDDANGERYMVDGGLSYFRRSVNKIPAEDLSQVFVKGDHEHNRQYFKWGTYGIDGDEELSFVTLENMNLGHIKCCLDTQNLAAEVIGLFKEEIKYRDKNK